MNVNIKTSGANCNQLSGLLLLLTSSDMLFYDWEAKFVEMSITNSWILFSEPLITHFMWRNLLLQVKFIHYVATFLY